MKTKITAVALLFLFLLLIGLFAGRYQVTYNNSTSCFLPQCEKDFVIVASPGTRLPMLDCVRFENPTASRCVLFVRTGRVVEGIEGLGVVETVICSVQAGTVYGNFRPFRCTIQPYPG